MQSSIGIPRVHLEQLRGKDLELHMRLNRLPEMADLFALVEGPFGFPSRPLFTGTQVSTLAQIDFIRLGVNPVTGGLPA